MSIFSGSTGGHGGGMGGGMMAATALLLKA
jgi:hypothetical protein